MREDFAKRHAAFQADVKAARENQFAITPEWVKTIADLHGVPMPAMVLDSTPVADPTAPAPSPTDPSPTP